MVAKIRIIKRIVKAISPYGFFEKVRTIAIRMRKSIIISILNEL